MTADSSPSAPLPHLYACNEGPGVRIQPPYTHRPLNSVRVPASDISAASLRERDVAPASEAQAAERPHAETPPAVVCPPNLDIARRLAAEGIHVYAIGTNASSCVKFSKSHQFVYCPFSDETDPSAYIDFVVEFGKSLGTTSVLFPAADRQVMIFSRHRNELQEHYRFVMPSHETVTRVTTKDGLSSIASEFSIPAPRTYLLSDDSDIRTVAELIPYPALLKPSQSLYWHTPEMTDVLSSGIMGARAKIVVCRDSEELVASYEALAAREPRMIVQEFIPGDDSRLVYVSFYADRDHRVQGYFAGRKLRIIPEGAASFTETFSDPVLQERVFGIVSDVGYEGLGGLEFKKDPRDEQYKMIEFNTRFSGWSGLGTHCGVDLALMAYADALDLPIESQLECQTGVRWVHYSRDIRAFMEYRKRGQLTYREWRRSLKGPKMVAIYAKGDWRLNAAYTFEILAKIAGRSWNRLMNRSSGARAEL